MKIVRFILGNFILFLNWAFPPKAQKHSDDKQHTLDALTQQMVLYQFESCPFCVKIRRVIKRLNLHIEIRNVLGQPEFEKQLIDGGGKRQVPCLRIQHDTHVQWLYESSAIQEYLENLTHESPY